MLAARSGPKVPLRQRRAPRGDHPERLEQTLVQLGLELERRRYRRRRREVDARRRVPLRCLLRGLRVLRLLRQADRFARQNTLNNNMAEAHPWQPDAAPFVSESTVLVGPAVVRSPSPNASP